LFPSAIAQFSIVATCFSQQTPVVVEWLTRIESFWHIVFVVAVLALVITTSAHAILMKRDHRAAVMWVAFIWLSPLIGAVCYLLLGVNRIRRRAARLRGDDGKVASPGEAASADAPPQPAGSNLASLVQLGRNVTGRPLLAGNAIQPLENGDKAFPAMLRAIDEASTSISLATYIFDHDSAGESFLAALTAAVKRGVAVRVLIDDVGARYSRPPMSRALRQRGVPCAHFLPQAWFRRFAAMNMRSHRKILVVDGATAFVGGMNIREGNLLLQQPPPRHPIRDLQFKVTGPVVAQLQATFVDDWHYCTGEHLAGEAWFPPLAPAGEVAGRVITDGPDEDLDKLNWMLHGALGAARKSIWIATPYFLPDQPLIAALTTAALRGVEIRIVLPARNNLPFVHWASRAGWWQVLKPGCRLWLTDGPFDHSKVVVIDETWSLVGSANWDARSLRLNFEVNLEAYDPGFARQLIRHLETKLTTAHEATLAEVNARPLPVRLLDGVARLFNPFL
jgi:cardiolipin synthase A/B